MMTSLSDVRCSIACCLLLCPMDTHCRKRHSISWRRKTRCIAGEYWQLPMTWHWRTLMWSLSWKWRNGEIRLCWRALCSAGTWRIHWTLNLIVFISVRWLSRNMPLRCWQKIVYAGWEIRQSIPRERSISTLSFVPPISGAIRCREKSWRGKRFMWMSTGMR